MQLLNVQLNPSKLYGNGQILVKLLSTRSRVATLYSQIICHSVGLVLYQHCSFFPSTHM